MSTITIPEILSESERAKTRKRKNISGKLTVASFIGLLVASQLFRFYDGTLTPAVVLLVASVSLGIVGAVISIRTNRRVYAEWDAEKTLTKERLAALLSALSANDELLQYPLPPEPDSADQQARFFFILRQGEHNKSRIAITHQRRKLTIHANTPEAQVIMERACREHLGIEDLTTGPVEFLNI